jgi:hypothetical protein
MAGLLSGGTSCWCLATASPCACESEVEPQKNQAGPRDIVLDGLLGKKKIKQLHSQTQVGNFGWPGNKPYRFYNLFEFEEPFWTTFQSKESDHQKSFWIIFGCHFERRTSLTATPKVSRNVSTLIQPTTLSIKLNKSQVNWNAQTCVNIIDSPKPIHSNNHLEKH